MMLRTNRFMVVALAALITGVAMAQQPADTLDLETALKRAAEQSASLKVAQFKLRAAEHQADAARSALFPTLFAEANAKHLTETGQLDLPQIGPAEPKTISLGVQDQYDLSARLAAPLYTGGTLRANIRAAQAEAAAADASARADSLSLVHDVRKAFYEALRMRARLNAIQVSQGRLQRTLDMLQGSVEAGMSSPDELLAVEAKLADLERNRVQMESGLQAAGLYLGGLLGDPDRVIVPHADLQQPLVRASAGLSTDFFDQSNGSSDTSLANDLRPEIEALQRKSDALSARQDAARAAWLPTVSAFAQYSYARPGLSFASEEWMDYGVVGVSASWTIWDFGSRTSRIESAEAATMAAQAGVEDARRNFDTVRNVASARLQGAREAYVHASSAAQLQEELLEHVRNRYNQGQASLRELLDAEDDVRQANLDEASAAADVRLAETEWLYATGQ